MSRSPALVPHRPDAAITATIFRFPPTAIHKYKMGESSANITIVPRIPHDGRKTGRSRVERPKESSSVDRLGLEAGGVERSVKLLFALRRSACRSNLESYSWLWFSGKKVLEPKPCPLDQEPYLPFRQCFGRREYRPTRLCDGEAPSGSLAVHFPRRLPQRHYRWTCYGPADIFLLDFLRQAMFIKVGCLVVDQTRRPPSELMPHSPGSNIAATQ